MSKMRLVYDESMNRLYLVNLDQPEESATVLKLYESLTGWQTSVYVNHFFTDEYLNSDEFVIEEWED